MASSQAVPQAKSTSKRKPAAKPKHASLAALVAAASDGDISARQALRQRTDDEAFEAVIAGIVAMPSEPWLSQLLAELPHPRARVRILAELARTTPAAVHACLVDALCHATPGKTKRAAEVRLLMQRLGDAVLATARFVAAHGTPAQCDELVVRLFELEISRETLTTYFPDHWDTARIFEVFSPYFLRQDRETDAGLRRIEIIRGKLTNRRLDQRWVELFVGLVRSAPREPILEQVLWGLAIAVEKLGRSRAPADTSDVVFALTENLTHDSRLWDHLDAFFVAWKEPRAAALMVRKLEIVKDPYRTLETLGELPKRDVATALFERLAAGPIEWKDRKRAAASQSSLERLIEDLRVHLPEQRTPTGPDVLSRLIGMRDVFGVERLLSAGADPNLGCNDDPTPPLILAIAAVYRDGSAEALQIVQHLLAAGANTNDKLGRVYEIRDVKSTKRDNAASIVGKLLAAVTPPYPIGNNNRYDEEHHDADAWLSHDEREAMRPVILQLVLLFAG